MAISLLKVQQIRNIKSLTLEPDPGINMFWGDNGSGKTSLLEAIYTIARGRSFRGRRAGPLITEGERELLVFCRSQVADRQHQIGVRKSSSETEVRHNGNKVDKLSNLALLTPLQIITPTSHELLERGPEYRRRFIEWGVFHVEHDYQQRYRTFLKALMNRNVALRSGSELAQLLLWDRVLADTGDLLDELRRRYFDLFSKAVVDELQYFLPGERVTLEWKRGWSQKQSLFESLEQGRERDRERGFTQSGPHRADIAIKFIDKGASHTASRGQQKLILAAMHIAQATLISQAGDSPPIILIDDLASELDKKNRDLLISRLMRLNTQVFLTGTEPLEGYSIKLFHVEHGTIIQ